MLRFVLLDDLDAADDGQGLHFALYGIDDAHDAKHEACNADDPVDKADDRDPADDAADDADDPKHKTLVRMETGKLRILRRKDGYDSKDPEVGKDTHDLVGAVVFCHFDDSSCVYDFL